jgi:hypothetical protein
MHYVEGILMLVLYPGCTLYIGTTLVLTWTVKGLQTSSGRLMNVNCISVLGGTVKYKEKTWEYFTFEKTL